MKEIKQFENSAILQILLFLYDRGKAKVTDIDVDASSGTVYRALVSLSKMELIDEERIMPYTRIIRLTVDGKAVARHVKEIEEIMEAKKARRLHQARS